MEDFEKNVLEQVTHKPACWFWYVNDISVIWPHGQVKLTVSEPPQWISHEYLVHSGKRRRPPSVSGYWHLQETGQLPMAQSLLEAHSYQSLYTLGFTSPTCEQTNSPGFPDTQSHSSLWLGLPHSRTGISHDCLKGKWIQPSADTSPEPRNADCQDQRKTHLNCIYTLCSNNIWPP
jgi:hypothetical protein